MIRISTLSRSAKPQLTFRIESSGWMSAMLGVGTMLRHTPRITSWRWALKAYLLGVWGWGTNTEGVYIAFTYSD